MEMAVKNPAHDDPIEDFLSDQILAKNPTTDFSGLTDIYWVWVFKILSIECYVTF